MRTDNRFEDLDRAALTSALLALKTCPHCRTDLQPVAFMEDVWGCGRCRETWHIPAGERPSVAALLGELKDARFCPTCGISLPVNVKVQKGGGK